MATSTSARPRRRPRSPAGWIGRHPLTFSGTIIAGCILIAVVLLLGLKGQRRMAEADLRAEAEKITKGAFWEKGVTAAQVESILRAMESGGRRGYVVSSDGGISGIRDPEEFTKLVTITNDQYSRWHAKQGRSRIGMAMDLLDDRNVVFGNSDERFVIVGGTLGRAADELANATAVKTSGYEKFTAMFGLQFYYP